MKQFLTPPFILLFSSICIAVIACLYSLYICRHRKTVGQRRAHKLSRHGNNPLLSPQSHREWERNGTFNPAAVMDDEGKVHLFYRAIGADGVSRIGHAASANGSRFTERSLYPVYQPAVGSGMPDAAHMPEPAAYNPLIYISGGSWAGAEDPRVTRIGDRIYMTYTAFGGWDDMRIGLSSVSVADLKKRRWKWKRPVLISPPKARCKNWVLFPEKINGKYAILHAVAPKVLIAYVDSLDAVPEIKTSPDHGGYGYHDSTRNNHWDKIMKGAGAPPIRTKKGWLLIYNAYDQHDPGKYKIGAMILDVKDPTKIIFRSPQPILSPEMGYENDGKPGIVYASGAVVKGDKLMVYYGGGDKHACMAETPLTSLLEWLEKYGKV